MNILYYSYGEIFAADLYESLTKLGHSVHKTVYTVPENKSNPELITTEIHKLLRSKSFDAIISFDFFEIASDAALAFSIPYISWIYDCPLYSLHSEKILNDSNYFFTFDALQYQLLLESGAAHVFYLPLAVHSGRLQTQLGPSPWLHQSRFDVSFVGRLYTNDATNLGKHLPDFYKGYWEGILDTQHLVYGYNFIMDMMPEELVTHMLPLLPVDLSKPFAYPHIICSDYINAELTRRERAKYLTALAESFQVTLFTHEYEKEHIPPKIAFGGPVDYINEMPYVFATSKINCNFTLRSITAGIPLRALDIMGAGGFLLSNYQADLAEHFMIGEECITFSSMEELLDKTEYYLAHEDERIQIAKQGCKKVQEEFSYQVQIPKMLEAVGLGG